MYNPTISLNLALDGAAWSTPRPGRFTPWKDPLQRTLCTVHAILNPCTFFWTPARSMWGPALCAVTLVSRRRDGRQWDITVAFV